MKMEKEELDKFFLLFKNEIIVLSSNDIIRKVVLFHFQNLH